MWVKMRVFSIFFIGIAFLLGCKNSEGAKTIRLAHTLDVNHSVHQAMVKMGEDLRELSDDRLHIEIYANQQLGTERECLELLQIGSLDMAKVSVGILENFAPKMKVLGLPFLFRSKEHSFKVMDGPIGQQLLDSGQKYWLKGLGFYDAGSRSFYSKERPIEHPDDLEGLKIRVMESKTAMDMVRSMGGSPTPISWGELYTSLQQGVVDGAENNPPSFYLSRHYEVCKYYSLSEHTFLPDVLIAGTHFWNRLSEQERVWLKEAVKNSMVYQRKLWTEAETKALKEVQKAGVAVIRPNKQPFEQRVEKIYRQYEDEAELYAIIQEIKAMEQ